ncbi:undecaprenyl-diphosphate phosphatase [Hyphomonas sp.]|uniref:undecaprenyl-diphosphate phosphatase n=1 Tax=Hyphomonas sp. TaxID=87 RepID=UPI00391C5C29
MSLIQLILIAIVQGVTEWLPISSSAHVLLASDFFGVTGRDELLINAISHSGTLVAMLIYFRKDVSAAIFGSFELALAPVRKPASLSRGARLALCILVATPFAMIGALLYDRLAPEVFQTGMRTVYTVAAATIFFGALLWWADVKGGRTRTEADMTLRDAILIGATQLIAVIIPGTSRSGITMTAARALGYERTEAARFAMLIGAPLLAAVSLYGILGLMTSDGESVLTFTDGLIVAAFSFVSGYASIGLLMTVVRRMSFLPFVIYRLALGVLLLLTSPFVMGWF